MVIISFVSQKGGVGKSSLARTLAREAANNDLSVKIADLDIQQATSTNWVRRRLTNEIEPNIPVEPFSTGKQAVSSNTNYDLLVVDGPARASKGTYEIAQCSNLLVQPTGASLDDLEPAVLLFHELVKKGIPKTSLVFALSRIGTESEEKQARLYLEQSGYEVLDGCIFEKPSYRQSQNNGYALTETSYKKLNEKADILMQSLINKVYS